MATWQVGGQRGVHHPLIPREEFRVQYAHFPWECRCGWQNRSNNQVCGGGQMNYGCGTAKVPAWLKGKSRKEVGLPAQTRGTALYPQRPEFPGDVSFDNFEDAWNLAYPSQDPVYQTEQEGYHAAGGGSSRKISHEAAKVAAAEYARYHGEHAPVMIVKDPPAVAAVPVPVVEKVPLAPLTPGIEGTAAGAKRSAEQAFNASGGQGPSVGGEAATKKPREGGPPPDGWIAGTDDTTGKTYYYHLATQKSQWDYPEEDPLPGEEVGGSSMGLKPPWVQLMDEQSQTPYYYNKKTKQSRWDHPISDVLRHAPEHIQNKYKEAIEQAAEEGGLKDAHAFTILISACAYVKPFADVEQARHLVMQIEENGFKPDKYTLPAMLKCCKFSKPRAVDLAIEWFQEYVGILHLNEHVKAALEGVTGEEKARQLIDWAEMTYPQCKSR